MDCYLQMTGPGEWGPQGLSRERSSLEQSRRLCDTHSFWCQLYAYSSTKPAVIKAIATLTPVVIALLGSCCCVGAPLSTGAGGTGTGGIGPGGVGLGGVGPGGVGPGGVGSGGTGAGGTGTGGIGPGGTGRGGVGFGGTGRGGVGPGGVSPGGVSPGGTAVGAVGAPKTGARAFRGVGVLEDAVAVPHIAREYSS